MSKASTRTVKMSQGGEYFFNFLLICVDFNSNEHTTKMLHSLDKYDNIQLDIIIVLTGDTTNKSNFNSIHKLHIFQSHKNLGYFGGIKFGLSKINITDFQKVIVCNNDIEIKDVYFFKKLSKINDDVIAPKIINQEGVNQNPHRLNKPTKTKLIYYKIYFFNFFVAKFIVYLLRIRKTLTSNFSLEDSKPIEIFSPHGAFIVFNKTYFQKGGDIDDCFFLYGEEDSVAGICYKLDLKVVFHPGIEIFHFESGSIGKKLSRFKYKNQKLAHKYILKKYEVFKY